jgi:uncharacterized membrane protein YbhN (UPF0104 family)
MSFGLLFWILMLFWLLLGLWQSWPNWQGWVPPNLLLFVLLLLLGWRAFGPPIHG